MRVIGARQPGGPDALEVLQQPEPEPGSGAVRVRVLAAPVNPTDTLIRSGSPLVHDRQPAKGPYVPGMDAAGVIDQLGPDTGGRLEVGQRVLALIAPRGSNGAYAEKVIVPAASVVAAPAHVDPARASTLLMNALTAWLALDAIDVSPGDAILVTGAAGVLGGYVTQLAKQRDLHVIADARESDADRIRTLGVTDVLSRGADIAAQVRTLVPKGVQGIIDGALMHGAVLPALARGGRLASLRGWAPPDRGDITVYPIRVHESVRDTPKLTQLVALVDDGALILPDIEIMRARDAAHAHRRLEEGGLRGRLVLDLSDIA